MLRRIFRVTVVFVVLLALGVAVLVLIARPRLENDQRAADTAWADLRPTIDTRYHAFDKTWQTVKGVDERQSRAIYAQIETALNRWGRVHGDPTSGPAAANRVEALANRLRATVIGSPKLRLNPVAIESFAAFDAAKAGANVVSAYNNSVESYQQLREDTLKGIVAVLLGYDARNAYEAPA